MYLRDTYQLNACECDDPEKQSVRTWSHTFRILGLYTGLEQIRGADTGQTLSGTCTVFHGPMAAFHQGDKIQNRT